MTTKLAFAIPTYNRLRLLERLVESIPSKYSIFISDNDSSIKGSHQFYAKENVHVSHASTLISMFANWNRAVETTDSSVTHIAIPSDDDLYLPEQVSHMSDTIASNTDVDIFIFGCDYIDEHENISVGYTPTSSCKYIKGDGFLQFINGVDARMPGVVFRKEFFKKIGGLNTEYELTAADSELIQKALLLGKSMFVNQTVGYYRIWSGSLTNARQGTIQWLKEVEKWTKTISEFIASSANQNVKKIDTKKFSADIYIQNLLAGYQNLIAIDKPRAKKFLRENMVMEGASLVNKLRLIKYWIL